MLKQEGWLAMPSNKMHRRMRCLLMLLMMMTMLLTMMLMVFCVLPCLHTSRMPSADL